MFCNGLIILEYKNEQVGDLFAAEPSFQKQAFPPICRTERRASIVSIYFKKPNL